MKKKLGIAVLIMIMIIGAVFIFVPQARMIVESIYMNARVITEFTVDGEILYMNGEINSKTPKQLKR